ncbi:MAG TPA: NUMOD4 domain-containing protein, partial [Tenuifilaceae bacterium]|nr:NUMOD4 domain-containing protein [Tenuifilaceae bacterium]
MVNSYPKEIWKELDYASKSGLHYAVSNFGRVVSYASTIEEAKEIKCGLNKGYKVLRRSYVKDGR